jgi:hypothetical protein
MVTSPEGLVDCWESRTDRNLSVEKEMRQGERACREVSTKVSMTRNKQSRDWPAER